MNIKETMKLCSGAKLYEKGTKVMWTDEYISKQLLIFHTDTSSDTASRSGIKIDKFVEWISSFGKEGGNVLDIGCGPGLYAERLAQKGYRVSGVDFSKASIDYAKNSAKQKGLDIEYRCMNYLDLEFSETADIAIMIYCDFCVLSRKEQSVLLQKIHKSLKKGGIFILDVYNDDSLQNRSFGKRYEFADDGFWKEQPYLCLSSTEHYEQDKAVLSQHIVYDEDKGFEVYRFWEHYFCDEEIISLFKAHGFAGIENCGNLLRTECKTIEDGITFYSAVK